MIMLLILIATTIFTGYGIIQTKRDGNAFGFMFSTVSFLILAFTTALAVML